MYEATSSSRTVPVFFMPWVPYHHLVRGFSRTDIAHYKNREINHCVKSVHIRSFFWSLFGHFSRSEWF